MNILEAQRMAHEAGKGSRPRPFSVSQDEWDNRWDAIFSREKFLEPEITVDNNTDNKYNTETEVSKD